MVSNDTTKQLNSEPTEPDKLETFCSVIDPLVRKLIEAEFAELDDADEWRQYRKEFRKFVRSLGIKLGYFDKVVPGSIRDFLLGYYLCAKGKAPGYVIDDTFYLLLWRWLYIFTAETEAMFEKLGQMPEEALHKFLHSFNFMILDHVDKDCSIIPKVSVIRSILIYYLINRADCLQAKVLAILCMPYSPFAECTPAEVISFLFEMRYLDDPEGPPFVRIEALPMITRILDALLAELKEKYLEVLE